MKAYKVTEWLATIRTRLIPAQRPAPYQFHIDLRQTADQQDIAIEDVIKALEEARDAELPMSFQEFEGGTSPVIVRYLEFHDGETALKPTDNRVKYCRVIAEEPFPERGAEGEARRDRVDG